MEAAGRFIVLWAAVGTLSMWRHHHTDEAQMETGVQQGDYRCRFLLIQLITACWYVCVARGCPSPGQVKACCVPDYSCV